MRDACPYHAGRNGRDARPARPNQVKPMQIKICGINDEAFALEAAKLGVDYLGFIFEASSPRCVDVMQASVIASELRSASEKLLPFRLEDQTSGKRRPRRFESIPRLVGVFVRQTPAEILDIMDRAGLDIVQLHRRATAEDVAALRASGREIWTLAGGAPGDGVLFDSSHGDGDSAFRKGAYKSILAGRLSADNAAEAIATGADVLDFNSSLETSPGCKSIHLLHGLIDRLGGLGGSV